MAGKAVNASSSMNDNVGLSFKRNRSRFGRSSKAPSSMTVILQSANRGALECKMSNEI